MRSQRFGRDLRPPSSPSPAQDASPCYCAQPPECGPSRQAVQCLRVAGQQLWQSRVHSHESCPREHRRPAPSHLPGAGPSPPTPPRHPLSPLDGASCASLGRFLGRCAAFAKPPKTRALSPGSSWAEGEKLYPTLQCKGLRSTNSFTESELFGDNASPGAIYTTGKSASKGPPGRAGPANLRGRGLLHPIHHAPLTASFPSPSSCLMQLAAWGLPNSPTRPRISLLLIP